MATASLASYGFASYPAAGQTWGPCLTQDSSQCQCQGCGVTVAPPPGCDAVAVECQRRESDISVDAGDPTPSDSQPITCALCPLCCTDPPCSCTGGTTSIGISLRTAVGCTDAEVTQDCLAQAVRCTSTDTKARITLERGRSATREHEWRFRRVYTHSEGKTCPIPGEHITSCGLDESQVSADILSAGCGSCVVDTTPCGPGCPWFRSGGLLFHRQRIGRLCIAGSLCSLTAALALGARTLDGTPQDVLREFRQRSLARAGTTTPEQASAEADLLLRTLARAGPADPASSGLITAAFTVLPQAG